MGCKMLVATEVVIIGGGWQCEAACRGPLSAAVTFLRDEAREVFRGAFIAGAFANSSAILLNPESVENAHGLLKEESAALFLRLSWRLVIFRALCRQGPCRG